jgi:Short C-terminal domain
MPFFRRRPLLRAAAVGGGAYMMGKHHAESQQREDYQDQAIGDLQTQQPAPVAVAAAPVAAAAPAGGITSEALDRLAELGKLHDQGVLTDEEFSAAKGKLLAG